MMRLRTPGLYSKCVILSQSMRYVVVIMLLFGLSCTLINRVFALDIVVIEPISSSRVIDFASADRTGEVELLINVARNEYEPASFLIYNNEESVDNVTVEIGDLISETDVIPSSHVDIKLVKKWFQAPGAWDTHRRLSGDKSVMVPELLLNDLSLIKVDKVNEKNYLRVNGKYVDISKRAKNQGPILWDSSEYFIADTTTLQSFPLEKTETQQVWITVYAGDNQKVGIYTGTVSIRDSTTILTEIPISVNVLPFELSDPAIEYSLFYRGKLHAGYGSISSEYKNRIQIQNDFHSLKEHGVCCPTIYQRITYKHAFENVIGSTPMDVLSEYMRIRESVGLSRENIYYIGMLANKYSEKTFKEFFEFSQLMRNIGAENIYLYGLDEATGERLSGQLDQWKTIKDDGYKIFVAGSKGHTSVAGSATDLLVLHGDYNEMELKLVKKAGGRLFVYSNPQVGVENPLVYRENYGYELWVSGYDGVMNYAYQHSMGLIWNDFDHPIYRDIAFSYPSSIGPINTIAWEGFREAVDDVRYLTLLAKQFSVDEGHLHDWGRAYLAELQSDGVTDSKDIRAQIISDLLDLH